MEKKNIVSIEERIPKLKQQRRKKQNRTLLLYLCLFFILIVVIVYLQSPFSNVKELSVTGNDLLSVDDVIEQSALELNSNIWRVRLKEVATVLEDHPLIKEAHITRKLPQTIEMNITEERIVGLVSEDSGLLPLTENGIIHSIENDSSLGKAPILSDFADETYLNRMVEELAKTSDSMLNLISEIVWRPSDKNKYKIVLYMNDGFEVHATIRDFANKIKAYPSVVSQLEPDEKGIIHMDVGVYVETYED